MLSSQLQPPQAGELEVSIFGPGYGEAIALHIGDGQWILVDSCSEPGSDKPASLEYLHHLDVAVSQAVRLIVATHWHDDHVRGISTLLRECKAAKLVIPGALTSQDFLSLIKLYDGRVVLGSSGLDEFVEVFRILDARKQHGTLVNPPKLAYSDKSLYSDSISLSTRKVQVRVHSLSPSDASIVRAGLDFAQRLPTSGERKKRITPPTPNDASVVLWVEIGDQKILLGADLERTKDSKSGWIAILNESTVISGKAAVFKVPHHGAESAHEPRVWSELLSKSAIAILSPFTRGGEFLPTEEDVQRLISLTPEAYITARPIKRRHKWTNKVVRESIEGATQDIYNTHSGWGQIRLRRSIISEKACYLFELFGDAIKLKAEMWSN